MTAFLTAIVLISFFGALTYMAKDLVGKNKETGKQAKPKATRDVKPVRKLIAHDVRRITDSVPDSKPIAAKEEILQFWTEIMNDPKHDMETRLKASELLGIYYSD